MLSHVTPARTPALPCQRPAVPYKKWALTANVSARGLLYIAGLSRRDCLLEAEAESGLERSMSALVGHVAKNGSAAYTRVGRVGDGHEPSAV